MSGKRCKAGVREQNGVTMPASHEQIGEFIKSPDWGAWMQDILDDIVNQEYARAIAKARGDYEPPDPPGFEGGFAENH